MDIKRGNIFSHLVAQQEILAAAHYIVSKTRKTD